jgi:GTP-binding protein Era
LKKSALLNVIAVYQKLHNFEAVVPVSAKTGDGVGLLLSELYKFAVPSPQLFPDG